MKHFFIIWFIFNFSFISFSQVGNDTLFLYTNPTHSKCVFSLSNVDKEFYPSLLPAITQNEEGEYVDNIHYLLQDTSIVLRNVTHFDLNTTWVPLFVTDGNYYLTDPKNVQFQGFILTDTTLITKMKEGIIVDILLGSDKNDSSYTFNTFSSGNIQKNVAIYWLDKENQIAIWKVSVDSNETYFLCVSEEKYMNFPICYYQNCTSKEFNFDTLDLKKIIQYTR